MPVRMDKSLIFIFCVQQLNVSKMYFKNNNNNNNCLKYHIKFPIGKFPILALNSSLASIFFSKTVFSDLLFHVPILLALSLQKYKPMKKYFFDNHLYQDFPGLCIPFSPINVASAIAAFSICQIILKTCSVKLIFTRKLS